MSRQAQTYLFALLLTAALLALAVQGVAAQQGGLDQAAKAVVRIRACDASGCQRGVGSGVIIDPSGLILTANHVTLSNPNDPLSSPLGDFVIELTEDFRLPPQPLYRARLAASDREHDLALLQIYGHEVDGSPVDWSALALPTLPLLDAVDVGLGEALHILGYPLVGGRSINYVKPELSGFEEASLIKVTGALGQGYSGGPALVVRDGEYHVVGAVIRQRGLALGQVGLIRTVDELPELSWTPDAVRVWIDSVDAETTSQSGGQTLSIAVELSAVDFSGHQGRVLAYLYDGATRLPWKPEKTSLPTSASRQVVLSQGFTGSAFIDRLKTVTLTASAGELADVSEDLAVRFVVWDMDEMKALWRDPAWRGVEMGSAVVALSATDTPVPPTDTPTLPTPEKSEPIPLVPTAIQQPEPESQVAMATQPSAPTATQMPEPESSQPTATQQPEPEPLMPTATQQPEPEPPAPTATQMPEPESSQPTATQQPEPEPLMPTATQQPEPEPPAPTATQMPEPESSQPTATQQPEPEPLMPTATQQPILESLVPITTNSELIAGEVREIGGIPFVYVPAGEFIMGSSDEQVDYAFELCDSYYYGRDNCRRSWWGNEQPQRTVYLDSFWIMQTEVTNAQYSECVTSGDCPVPDIDIWNDIAFADHPVQRVTWDDAVSYAVWLSGETGQTLQLPTEAQWEKAARGDTGRIFPWGDFWDPERLNYCDRNCNLDGKDKDGDDGYADTAPVGSYFEGASPYGTFDMAGNASEWNADWYDNEYYKVASDVNPAGPESGDRRVVRGGEYRMEPGSARSADRNSLDPVYRQFGLGFRLISPID